MLSIWKRRRKMDKEKYIETYDDYTKSVLQVVEFEKVGELNRWLLMNIGKRIKFIKLPKYRKDENIYVMYYEQVAVVEKKIEELIKAEEGNV